MHGHFDDDHLRLAPPLRRRLHQRVVDADLRQRRVDAVERIVLIGRAPGAGDLVQPLLRVGQVGGQLIGDEVAAPDEHAAVPVVALRLDVPVGRGLVGLFPESLHAVRAGRAAAELKRLAAVDVAQPRVAVRGDDAERHQRVGSLGDDVERSLN